MAQQQVLRLGLGLNIQRSDGRIHSAVVSGLNEAQQSITVEWFEGGETKGKEVSCELMVPSCLILSHSGSRKRQNWDEVK